ncbi:MAG: hypothetical protein KGL39_24905 [Patescibacteria group bacterium]|nr:hypothetical protein [Patescibacteria group bacterium]
MYATLLVAMIGISQISGTPDTPPCGWHLTQFHDGTVRQAWGWKDAQGYVHIVEPSRVEAPKPPVANYGLDVAAINKDGEGAVRASDLETHQAALEIAEKPTDDELDRLIPKPPDLFWGVEREIAEAVFWGLVAFGILLSVLLIGAGAWLRSKQS